MSTTMELRNNLSDICKDVDGILKSDIGSLIKFEFHPSAVILGDGSDWMYQKDCKDELRMLVKDIPQLIEMLVNASKKAEKLLEALSAKK